MENYKPNEIKLRCLIERSKIINGKYLYHLNRDNTENILYDVMEDLNAINKKIEDIINNNK